MTVGYFGAGYWTTIYELENDIVGYAGEPARLKLLEHTVLSKGKVMYYRKFKDIHTQLAPEDEISVSLNLLVSDAAASVHEQYEFDIENGIIIGSVNRLARSQDLLFDLVKVFGEEEELEICRDIARKHVNPRARIRALEVLASKSSEGESSIWESASNDASAIVQAESARRAGLKRFQKS